MLQVTPFTFLHRSVPWSIGFCAALLWTMLLATPAAHAQVGHVLSGVGPVDQAWSGAGTANPQDALSAMHWNPAAITGLQSTSINLSLQVLIPSGDLSSSVDPDVFGPGFPSGRLAGSTSSDAGPFPIPAVGFAHAPEASPWAFGLSAFGVGGFGVDYELDSTNPLTTPQPPQGMGFGPVESEFQLLQVAPTVAYKVSERMSVGVSPTLNVSTLKVFPFPATSPDDGNGDGFPSYPGAPKETAFGYGFQAGVQVTDLSGVHLGASFKSTQSFDDFEFEGEDETGAPRSFAFNLDYPMILSFGVGYSGIDRFEFAADLRYIDFENTDGFNNVGFDQTGAVTGFGWNSIVVVSAGIQYDVTEKLPVRVGYSFNENPIDDERSFFNVPSPAIIQNRISGGFSYDISNAVTGSLALQYGLKNETEGRWVAPMGAVPGTQVKNELSTFFVIFGFEVRI